MSKDRIQFVRQFKLCFTFSFIALALLACGKSASIDGNGENSGPRNKFPFFGDATTYAVLANTGVINSGTGVIYGDIGTVKGAITGTDKIKRTGGQVHTADAVAAKAQSDAAVSYGNVNAKACDFNLSGEDLSGKTLTPGTYCFDGDATLMGKQVLHLDFQGNKSAYFLFRVGRNLITGPSAGILLDNKGESCNVFWTLPGTAWVDRDSNFQGGILALGDITMREKAVLNGKLVSRNGSISLNSNEIYNNTCNE